MNNKFFRHNFTRNPPFNREWMSRTYDYCHFSACLRRGDQSVFKPQHVNPTLALHLHHTDWLEPIYQWLVILFSVPCYTPPEEKRHTRALLIFATDVSDLSAIAYFWAARRSEPADQLSSTCIIIISGWHWFHFYFLFLPRPARTHSWEEVQRSQGQSVGTGDDEVPLVPSARPVVVWPAVGTRIRFSINWGSVWYWLQWDEERLFEVMAQGSSWNLNVLSFEWYVFLRVCFISCCLNLLAILT